MLNASTFRKSVFLSRENFPSFPTAFFTSVPCGATDFHASLENVFFFSSWNKILQKNNVSILLI